MASQGGTRYEDRTMGRGSSVAHNNAHNYSVSHPEYSELSSSYHSLQADSVPMENLSLYNSVSGPAGGRMYPAGQHMVSQSLHLHSPAVDI